MAYCPSCGKGYVYYPFYGSPECINSSCKFYSGKHYLAMKDLIEKEPEPIYKTQEDDEDPQTSFGWAPYPTYSQAVSASLARAKKP